jgi:hypothetical protein
VNQIIRPLNVERQLITENGQLIVADLHTIYVTNWHPIFGLANGTEPMKDAAKSLNCGGVVWLANIGVHLVKVRSVA